MALSDGLPIEIDPRETVLTPAFVLVIAVPVVFGGAHHIDHMVRGNHVGWPLTAVNPFTYSLAIYPLLAISLVLTVTDRVGYRYWTGFFLFSTGMLAYFHVSPWAVEPPQDVIGPYSDPLAGYRAFAVLLALIGSVLAGAVVSRRPRQHRRQRRPVVTDL